jgi:hypothetical protein
VRVRVCVRVLFFASAPSGSALALQQAALNYAAAHELETEEGRSQPSPYARLNQLTLEMLAGDGSESER